jgi:hypothetical protein
LQYRCTLLLSALAAAACGQGPQDETLDIVYDPCVPLVIQPENASEAELKSIDDALPLWNEIAGTQLTRDPSVDAPRLIIRFEESAPMFYGIYLDETGDIVVNKTLDQHYERMITVAHEIGHALGLWHVNRGERVSVMNPSNVKTPPMLSDAQELEATWGTCPAAAP